MRTLKHAIVALLMLGTLFAVLDALFYDPEEEQIRQWCGRETTGPCHFDQVGD